MVIFDNQIKELFDNIKSDIIEVINSRYSELMKIHDANSENLISITRASKVLKVSRSTLYTWVNIKGFRYVVKNNKRYLDLKYIEDLKSFLAKENKYYSNTSKELIIEFIKTS